MLWAAYPQMLVTKYAYNEDKEQSGNGSKTFFEKREMRDVVLMFTYFNFKDPNGLLDFGFSLLCDGSFRSFLDTGSFKSESYPPTAKKS